MQIRLITERLDKDLLWRVAPILFGLEYSKEVGEAPLFNFNNEIVAFYAAAGDEIVSFCIDEYDGNCHNWRYDYTLPEHRGAGINNKCFVERSNYCFGQSCKIEVRQPREEKLISYGFKTYKRRGQWCFMRRD
jgi:hypothetical protein